MAIRLDDPLTQRLRLPHHRLWVRRLVGRDENETTCTERGRGVGERPGAERVVANGLDRVRLHHGDVLVGRGVEDDTRSVGLEHLTHLGGVLDIGDNREAEQKTAFPRKLAVDLEQRRLGVVDENELERAEPGELAAKLRANRAACTRDHDDLTGDVARDRFEIDLNWLSTQDVLDLDRTELRREIEITADKFGQAR